MEHSSPRKVVEVRCSMRSSLKIVAEDARQRVTQPPRLFTETFDSKATDLDSMVPNGNLKLRFSIKISFEVSSDLTERILFDSEFLFAQL